MSVIDTYRSQFQAVNGSVPPRIRELRVAAMERFADLGFPTPRLEEWKYTNVAPLATGTFAPANGSVSSRVDRKAIARVSCPSAYELVFVDGRFVASLSTVASLPRGVHVVNLATAMDTEAALVDAHLARYADYGDHSFTALNTAFITDGAFVYLPKEAVLDAPIHLVFLTTASETPVVCYPRTLIVAGESSQATVIESYLGLGGGRYFTNAVSEILVGANAHLTHYKLQREGDDAFHIGTVVARQQAASTLTSHSVSFGGSLVRSDTHTTLDAEGSTATLNGLYLASGTQHVDHHTLIDHQKPHCSSRELYKGVLDGHATGVFNGKVFVRPDAQQSDAGQVNKNLLLSEGATMNTKPQLEIFADDVKCSHGATIGRLDADAIFYLRARGIGAATARNLLIYAFANELLNRMAVEPIRAQLEATLSTRLHHPSSSEASA